MKKHIITFAFLTFGFVGFAQKTFTQVTLNEILDEYKKDSKAFFINRLSDDGRYSNQQGSYLGKADVVKGDKQNIVSTELLQPVILQSGDLAVSSGIHKTLRIEKDGSQTTGRVVATYTFQRRNDKWMFVASQQNAIAPSTFDEATFNGMMARLQNDPTFFKNEADPTFTIIFGNGAISSREAMLKFAESNVGFYKRIESNLKVRQVGNSAVVTGIVDESFLTKTNPRVVSRSDKEVFTYTFSQVNGKWLWVSAQHTDYKEPVFTTETWKELLNEYKNDSKAFFANRLSDDFRYPLSNGKSLNRNDVTAWDKENILNTEMKDPIVFQSGDLAVVTGRHITEHGVEKDKAPHTDNFAATYTWQRKNGKWMFVASQHLSVVEK